MGTEYPKGDRRFTSGPLRQFPGFARTQRKSFSTTSTIVDVSKVPKTALTPISRFKKFQKLRDRNLRKKVLHKNTAKKHLNMLESIESQPASESSPVVQSPIALKEMAKMENCQKENSPNGHENGENGLNGIQEEVIVEHNGTEQENGEVRRSPRKSKGNDKIEEEIIIPEVESETSDKDEQREIEVNVQVIDSSASTSRRRSTPKIQPPDMTSYFDENFEVSDGDLNWRSDTIRITGRRPIRDMSPPKKRKSDEYYDEPSSKRMAYTPSVPSPGWRFLSPFSLFKRTPRTISNRPVDDSLLVNVSTDSQVDTDLDSSLATQIDSVESSSEETIERPTTEPPTKASWLCRIM